MSFEEIYEKLSKEDKYKVFTYAKTLMAEKEKAETKIQTVFSYLKVLPDETERFVLQVQRVNDLNLWNSVHAFLDARKNITLNQAFSEYLRKYGKQRPFVVANKNHMLILFKTINLIRKNEQKNYLED